jgi:hypothetical protein
MRCLFLLILLASIAAAGAGGPATKGGQNPSPMVEHTRAHPRLKEERPPGKRIPLRVGTLYLPDKLPAGNAPLFIHFHGATWIPEVAATRLRAAVITVQLGAGSAAYAKPFTAAKSFAELLQEAEAKAGRKFDSVGLTAWSAGYGAVRAILTTPENFERVQFVLLLDGLHSGYVGGKPGPKESNLMTEDLAVFVKFAKDAAAGKKQFVLTHTEIFPGTFASTTETADYLLNQLSLQRKPVLRWGTDGHANPLRSERGPVSFARLRRQLGSGPRRSSARDAPVAERFRVEVKRQRWSGTERARADRF